MTRGIQRIFGEVSHTYEIVNHLLTFGTDILLRRMLAQLVGSIGGTRWLDVCSGTGEVVDYMSRVARRRTDLFALDFSWPMLRHAVAKLGTERVTFTVADAGAIPFEDNTFDVMTVSFATRNVNTNRRALLRVLKEFRRALRPGGAFINLESSQPPNGVVRLLFHLYVSRVVRHLGELISGSRRGYAYLSSTVRRFHNAEGFAAILHEAGFRRVAFRRLMLGVFAMHIGVK